MWRTLIVLALFPWTAQVTGDSHCLDDLNSCLPNFRGRLLDNDHFWFGTPYSTQCPGLVFCVNDRPDLQSVASRVLATNASATLQSAVASIQVLNVTFERPAVSFFACDKMFSLQAQVSKTLDPLDPANLPQIYVQTQPTVTWSPGSGQPLYTFILYDTSYLFLHTVYVNCPGGSLNDCEVARPWLGSAAGFLINSAYVYLVYEQTRRVPTSTVQQAIAQTAAEGMAGSTSPLGAFYLPSMFQRLSAFYDPEIKFATIMEMYPDPYGSSRLTDYFVNTDQCPLFYSQLPPFHSAVDFDVTACCANYQLTRGSHMVSALDSKSVRASMTRHVPRVFLSPVVLLGPTAGRNAIAALLYTLVVVDAAPVISDNATGNNLTVHWVVANILGSEFRTGTELIQYTPPTPINASSPVVLMFMLFSHSTAVDSSLLSQLCPETPIMCQLNMADLVTMWNFDDVVGINWVQSVEDGFSLKRQYTEMGKPEGDVCKGRAGYASPCPAPQPCSAIRRFSFSSLLLIGPLIAAIYSVRY